MNQLLAYNFNSNFPLGIRRLIALSYTFSSLPEYEYNFSAWFRLLNLLVLKFSSEKLVRRGNKFGPTADPVTFTIVYTLVFNAIKFAGAFFFGIGFWSMARKIQQKSLKSFLAISAYGLILLFVTNQATLLLNTLFPPLGLMTACFVGLSSFLLLVGTYSAAVSVSNDTRIRKAIRSSVEMESHLIGDIGDAEMQMTLNAKVFSMMNKLQKRLQEDTQVESSLTDDDIKNYTNQVIQELIQRKKSK